MWCNFLLCSGRGEFTEVYKVLIENEEAKERQWLAVKRMRPQYSTSHFHVRTASTLCFSQINIIIYAWFWLSYYSYWINFISFFSVFVKIHQQAVVLESSDNCHGSISLPQSLLPRHGLRQTCRCQLQSSTKTSPVTISRTFSQHSKIKSYPFVF